MNKTILNSEQEKEIIEIYNNTDTHIHKICRKFCICRDTFMKILEKYNIKYIARRIFLEEENKSKIIERYKNGESANKLAKDYNYTLPVITKFLKENDILRSFEQRMELKEQKKIKENFIHVSKYLYHRWKSQAKEREILWDLIPSDIEKQYLKQNGKCFYTGIAMKWTNDWRIHINQFIGDPEVISLDRSDSDKDYTKNNIVLCCRAMNFAKNDTNINIFQNFINKIKNNSLKNEELIEKTEDVLTG